MKIISLIENDVCHEQIDVLEAEHGLSLYIEFEDKKILYDLGQSDLFIKNAKLLNIDLADIDAVVISHGHYDHGGGLKHFFEINQKAEVFMHLQSQKKLYRKADNGTMKYIGLDSKTLEENKDRINFLNGDCAVYSNVFVTQNFGYNFPESELNNVFYEAQGDDFIPDKFGHEMALVIHNNQQMVVFTGCSHRGVVNMLDGIQKRFPLLKINSVVGGLHIHNPSDLTNESKEYIDALVSEIKASAATFYSGHCTGKENFKRLQEILGDRMQNINVGQMIDIDL